jgi:hypothetical protein
VKVSSDKLRQLAGHNLATRDVDELIAVQKATADRIAAAIERQSKSIDANAQAVVAAVTKAIAEQRRPSNYQFTIERNASGVITGVRATAGG